MESGLHPTLHSKCHHQIIYSKLNLKIEYPPPYTRKIWNYSRSETDLINHSIESFDWSKLFSGKNVHEQVELFNRTLLIPSKIIVCNDRDPPWMNDEIKKWLRDKIYYSKKIKVKVKGNLVSLTILNLFTQDIWDVFTSSNLTYYEGLANKLKNSKTAPKTYWKILKTFVNSTKISLISALLVGNQLVSNFLEKANLFNDYNARQQCYPSKYKFCNQGKIVSFWNLSTWYCKERPMDTMK